METTISFGYWIRRQRKALDLTQQALADRVGCSLAAVKKIEGDERRPSRQIAERLAEVLGVPADQREIFLEVARGLRPVDQLLLARGPSIPASTPLRHNLPIQLTSFIGREHELAEAKQILANTHLLTLIGPGGTGKTRLALQIAQEVLPLFTNGVWLVELAPLSDPALILQAITSVFELREARDMPLIEILTNYLRAKQLLLVLDNCEHLIAACAKLSADLLRVCPQLKILISSREALGVSGETVFRVPSLSLPYPGQVTREAIANYESIQLFVERARAVQPHFALTHANAFYIAPICQRLDGIPLALELAAARIAVFSPEEIASRLDDRFRLLTGGSRTALERHQTLSALIDWSYDLLSDEERIVFRQLSVFAGGWTFEAAEAVCPDLDVINRLTQLVNKSLVIVDEQGQRRRYRLPETIRQYARDKLLEKGESEQAWDRHLDFFLRFAETAEPKLRSGEQIEWLDRLETEYDNFRTALGWSLESGNSESALRLSGALSYFWELRGMSEGCKWLDDALALSARGQSGTVVESVQRAKALYGSGRIRIVTLLDWPASYILTEESLRLSRELGDKWRMAVALENLGFLSNMEGNVPTARAHLEESVSLARQVGDPWLLAFCLERLAGVMERTDATAGRQIREEGVALARKVGDRSVLSEGLGDLAPFYLLEGNLTTATALVEEALAAAHEIRDLVHIEISLLYLAIVMCLQGDTVKAKGYCFEALAFAQEKGASQWALLAVWGFGFVAIFSGQSERGARLFAAVDARVRQHGINLWEGGERGPGISLLRQGLEKAREQLGPVAFQVAWAEGQQMTAEQALALATENENEDSPLPKDGVESSSE